MSNLIPKFDHNLVLPPHLGDPTLANHLSPYQCTTLDLCERLGTTPERRRILGGFLSFRERLQTEGLMTGFQWLDGSFLEDIELRDGRPPRDLDVVTVYWGYDLAFQTALLSKFPEVANPVLAKAKYSLDHYPFDAGYRPEVTLEKTRYWISLFSHNRSGVWKGMLRIQLNTPAEDAAARQELAKVAP
ncbi:MAG: hypothetical protein NTX48_08120 [Planctomycetales bacterium]|nr:hypothetical protein [Planctomycetales bacterium]